MSEAQKPAARRGILHRRWLRATLASILVLLVAWLTGCWLVVVHPRTNAPQHADAILVLGPPDENGRVDEAYRLADAGYASTLVISVGSEQQRLAKHACTQGIPKIQVICFRPDPATTQGEAHELRQLAAQHGWNKVIVVTSTYHVSRSRMIVERCFPGTVYMVKADRNISLTQWSYEFAYQTGAYLKAFLRPGC